MIRARRRRLSMVALAATAALVPGGLARPPAEAAASDHRLTEAANTNQVSVPELRQMLRDPAVHLGSGDKLYFVDPAPGRALGSAAGAPPTLALSQTFLLHSKPGSQRTIYLDVDGGSVTGTAWNTGNPALLSDDLPAATYPGWDPDGNGAAFSDAEKLKVQDVWQRVSEDFAPFDVDVTTQDPGEAAIDRAGIADQSFGTRVLISDSTVAEGYLCGSCGGLALFDVFDAPSGHSKYQPAWVFSHRLQTTKNIAEAASHEVGHNFGLDHDGPGYDVGHDSWAPIMGASYYRPITQWSRGDYAGADNHEDDLAMIASNGAPERQDEAGSTTATAGALSSTPAYISTAGDRDVYAIGRCSGALTVTARPAAVSPNLDIRLRLLDSGGAQVALSDPLSSLLSETLASGLDASIQRAVPADTYFVEVDGVGRGTPTAAYDDYASVGAYTLAVRCTTTAALAPGAPGSAAATATGQTSVRVAWSPPTTDGGSPVTGYAITRNGGTTQMVGAGASSVTVSGLAAGTAYTFTVAATNAAGTGPGRQAGATTAPATAPSAVRIGEAASGTSGGPVTATIAWQPPTSDGGSGINGFQIYIYRKSGGTYVFAGSTDVLSASSRASHVLLTPGTFTFAVRARNSAGFGALSARSSAVLAR